MPDWQGLAVERERDWSAAKLRFDPAADHSNGPLPASSATDTTRTKGSATPATVRKRRGLAVARLLNGSEEAHHEQDHHSWRRYYGFEHRLASWPCRRRARCDSHRARSDLPVGRFAPRRWRRAPPLRQPGER